MNTSAAGEKPAFWKRVHWGVWCLFGLALMLLAIDHWAHIFGVLPYLVLLACPLMHLFMHGKHGQQHHQHDQDKKTP